MDMITNYKTPQNIWQQSLIVFIDIPWSGIPILFLEMLKGIPWKVWGYHYGYRLSCLNSVRFQLKLSDCYCDWSAFFSERNRKKLLFTYSTNHFNTFRESRKCLILRRNWHCVKSVRIRSYSGPYSVQMRENTDQNNSKYGHFQVTPIKI